jgi:hypothetical protein
MSQDKCKYTEEAERLLGEKGLISHFLYDNGVNSMYKQAINVLTKVLEEKDELIQEVQELRGEVLWLKKEDK